MERAVTWLFSHPDGQDTSSSSPTAASGAEALDTGDAEYELFAFISHKGTSTGCGHYVAHVRAEEGGWILMNDEKVVGVPASMVDQSVAEGYVYFYRRQ